MSVCAYEIGVTVRTTRLEGDTALDDYVESCGSALYDEGEVSHDTYGIDMDCGLLHACLQAADRLEQEGLTADYSFGDYFSNPDGTYDDPYGHYVEESTAEVWVHPPLASAWFDRRDVSGFVSAALHGRTLARRRATYPWSWYAKPSHWELPHLERDYASALYGEA